METSLETVLVGKENSVNTTFMEILDDQPHIHSRFWPRATIEERLADEKISPIDVLIVDLTSFSRSPAEVIKSLAGCAAITSILAMHFYTNQKVIQPILDAGAQGYLTLDTHEKEILAALDHLRRGETYVGIKKHGRKKPNTKHREKGRNKCG